MSHVGVDRISDLYGECTMEELEEQERRAEACTAPTLDRTWLCATCEIAEWQAVHCGKVRSKTFTEGILECN